MSPRGYPGSPGGHPGLPWGRPGLPWGHPEVTVEIRIYLNIRSDVLQKIGFGFGKINRIR